MFKIISSSKGSISNRRIVVDCNPILNTSYFDLIKLNAGKNNNYSCLNLYLLLSTPCDEIFDIDRQYQILNVSNSLKLLDLLKNLSGI